MSTLVVIPVILMAAPQIAFQRHPIDAFPAGYQVAVADLNGDGRLDVVALSTEGSRVDWYENPTWKRRPVARVERPIDLAVHDIDGDGKPEIAVAAGFYFGDSSRGGQIVWLNARASLDEAWDIHPVAADPVTHRLRWADLEGDGRAELVHAPIFGPGSKANLDPKPSHLWAFRPPKDPAAGKWDAWKIDESLTVLHGLWVGRPNKSGRDEILTASYEGIFRFRLEAGASPQRWERIRIAAGAKPVDAKPGAARGSSEVALGHFNCSWDPRGSFIAAIEPWHGHEVVVYLPGAGGGLWERRVLDDTLVEGHALVVADFDGDGQDEIIAGWRGGGGGLTLYDPADALGSSAGAKGTVPDNFKLPLDRGIAVEGAVAADLNGDGKLDLVAIAGRTNNLVWYENRR